MKPRLLLVAHRVPYPPDRGDKLRVFHVLKALSEHYRVTLAAFADDDRDLRYAATLGQWCEEVHLVRLTRTHLVTRAALGLLSGSPLTVSVFSSGELSAWLAHRCRDGFYAAVASSSGVAQYLEHARARGTRVIVDLMDVDSDKWRQLGTRARWPMSWLWHREARTLGETEREIARTADALVFTSTAEVQLFNQQLPESARKCRSIPNGVDYEFFDPRQGGADPYGGAGKRCIVFTGVMNYWPNADAMVWFAREILPVVRRRMAGARLIIVGSRPSRAVRDLARDDGVTVTGFVDDVRPYLAHARVAIAPLRVARGLQNKVIEALAMGCPVVATPEAVRGLEPATVPGVTVAHGTTDFAEAVTRRLQQPVTDAAAIRQFVIERFDWSRNLTKFIELVDGPSLCAGDTP